MVSPTSIQLSEGRVKSVEEIKGFQGGRGAEGLRTEGRGQRAEGREQRE